MNWQVRQVSWMYDNSLFYCDDYCLIYCQSVYCHCYHTSILSRFKPIEIYWNPIVTSSHTSTILFCPTLSSPSFCYDRCDKWSVQCSGGGSSRLEHLFPNNCWQCRMWIISNRYYYYRSIILQIQTHIYRTMTLHVHVHTLWQSRWQHTTLCFVTPITTPL